MSWIKDYVNHRSHPKFVAAGFWAAIVVEQCWRIASDFKCFDGDVTRYWTEEYLARATMWPSDHMDQLKEAMAKAVEVGLIDFVKDRVVIHNWKHHQDHLKLKPAGSCIGDAVPDDDEATEKFLRAFMEHRVSYRKCRDDFVSTYLALNREATDVELAIKVLAWAYSQPSWPGGGSWKRVLITPTVFWDKWKKIARQYEDGSSRGRSTRMVGLRGTERSAALRAKSEKV